MNPSDPVSPPVHPGDASPLPASAARGNLFLGLAGGLIGAFIGAVLWAAITFATDRKIGLIAIGVGLAAGFGVRLLGKGNTTTFSIVGALCALAGCVVGDFLAVIAYGSKAAGIPFLEGFSRVPLGSIMDVMKSVFEPMDILFYGIAVYEGWRFSVVQD